MFPDNRQIVDGLGRIELLPGRRGDTKVGVFGGGKSRNRGGSPAAPVSIEAVVSAYPGPAIRLTSTGNVADRNAAACALGEGNGAAWLVSLFRWLVAAGAPASTGHRSMIDSELGPRCIEWTPVPLPDNTVLVLGRDITIERSLRRALTDSRHRFRDFAELACDFAWETDDSGAFSYVSDPCPLGYDPGGLIGTPAHALVTGAGLARSPFEARKAVRNAPVTLRNRLGEPKRFQVHARPIIDADGVWRGARGVCRRQGADA